MLVLSRKPGERILIGDDISITIARIGPNTVRLGIDAPREFEIVREELTDNSSGAVVQPGGRCGPLNPSSEGVALVAAIGP